MAPLLDSTISHRSWSVCTSMGLLSQRTRVQRGKRSECLEANVLLMMVRTSAWICTGQRTLRQTEGFLPTGDQGGVAVHYLQQFSGEVQRVP